VQEEPICIEDRMRELGLFGAEINLSSTIGIQIEKNLSMRMVLCCFHYYLKLISYLCFYFCFAFNVVFKCSLI
jgi:hypothetical protein